MRLHQARTVPATIAVNTASHAGGHQHDTGRERGNEHHSNSEVEVHVWILCPCAPFYPDPDVESDLGVQDDGVVSQEEVPLGDIAANDASNDDEEEGDEHEDDDVKQYANVI